MVTDFKGFPNNAFETAEFWCVISLQLFYVHCKGKTPLFSN